MHAVSLLFYRLRELLRAVHCNCDGTEMECYLHKHSVTGTQAYHVCYRQVCPWLIPTPQATSVFNPLAAIETPMQGVHRLYPKGIVKPRS